MREYRCPKCKKLLFIGNMKGDIEIICKNCKKKTHFIMSELLQMPKDSILYTEQKFFQK